MTVDPVDFVEVIDSDPTWPARYAEELEAIRRALGPNDSRIRYEHIGSTAVPGLAAKPIIDVLLIPADGEWPRDRIRAALSPLGYLYWEDNPNPRHLFFVKGMPPFGTSENWRRAIRRIGKRTPEARTRSYPRSWLATMRRTLTNAEECEMHREALGPTTRD